MNEDATINLAERTANILTGAAFDTLLHPRVPAGSETGGEFQRTLFPEAKPVKTPFYSRDLPMDTEENFRAQKFSAPKEFAMIIKDGKPIRVIGGTHKHDVIFSEDAVQQMAGATLIHNHPGGSALSYTDFVLAEKCGIARIEAFGTDGKGQKNLWIADRPKDGWPTKRTIAFMVRLYKKQFTDEARRRWKAGEVDLETASHECANRLMEKISEACGIEMKHHVIA